MFILHSLLFYFKAYLILLNIGNVGGGAFGECPQNFSYLFFLDQNHFNCFIYINMLTTSLLPTSSFIREKHHWTIFNFGFRLVHVLIHFLAFLNVAEDDFTYLPYYLIGFFTYLLVLLIIPTCRNHLVLFLGV